MSFEFQPDDDPHEECRHEIHRLQAIADAAMALRAGRDAGQDDEEMSAAWEALEESVGIGPSFYRSAEEREQSAFRRGAEAMQKAAENEIQDVCRKAKEMDDLQHMTAWMLSTASIQRIRKLNPADLEDAANG